MRRLRTGRHTTSITPSCGWAAGGSGVFGEAAFGEAVFGEVAFGEDIISVSSRCLGRRVSLPDTSGEENGEGERGRRGERPLVNLFLAKSSGPQSLPLRRSHITKSGQKRIETSLQK